MKRQGLKNKDMKPMNQTRLFAFTESLQMNTFVVVTALGDQLVVSTRFCNMTFLDKIAVQKL